MPSVSYPLGYMQYINEASRKACCKDDFTSRTIFQEYLDDLSRHGFGVVDENLARDWLTSAIRKLSLCSNAPAPV